MQLASSGGAATNIETAFVQLSEISMVRFAIATSGLSGRAKEEMEDLRDAIIMEKQWKENQQKRKARTWIGKEQSTDLEYRHT